MLDISSTNIKNWFQLSIEIIIFTQKMMTVFHIHVLIFQSIIFIYKWKIYFYILMKIYRPVKSAYQTFYNYKSFQGQIDGILCFISLSIKFFMISF